MKKNIFVLILFISSCYMPEKNIVLKSDRVDGVKQGTRLMYNGRAVGSVSHIKINEDLSFDIDILLQEGVYTRCNTRFVLIPSNLFGDNDIEIDTIDTKRSNHCKLHLYDLRKKKYDLKQSENPLLRIIDSLQMTSSE